MMRAICILLTALVFSCGGDPMRDRAEDALGPEAPGETPGPTHRAGQPCAVCHREDGPARAFVAAGTIFERRGERKGAEGVIVELTDRFGARRVVMTNAAGNFFVNRDDWPAAFPVGVRLVVDGQPRAMQTVIQRESSCAKCHSDPSGPTSAGALYR
jgi:hypothetical protein